MQSFAKLFIAAVAASVAAASPTAPVARQLSGLPALPFCLTGGTTSALPLPTGLVPVACSAGQTCTSLTDLTSVPILGSIISGIMSELPVGVGMCSAAA